MGASHRARLAVWCLRRSPHLPKCWPESRGCPHSLAGGCDTGVLLGLNGCVRTTCRPWPLCDPAGATRAQAVSLGEVANVHGCRVVLCFQINKDLEGSVSFLAQTGRFAVPLKCSTKKCSVGARAGVSRGDPVGNRGGGSVCPAARVGGAGSPPHPGLPTQVPAELRPLGWVEPQPQDRGDPGLLQRRWPCCSPVVSPDYFCCGPHAVRHIPRTNLQHFTPSPTRTPASGHHQPVLCVQESRLLGPTYTESVQLLSPLMDGCHSAQRPPGPPVLSYMAGLLPLVAE